MVMGGRIGGLAPAGSTVVVPTNRFFVGTPVDGFRQRVARMNIPATALDRDPRPAQPRAVTDTPAEAADDPMNGVRARITLAVDIELLPRPGAEN